MSEYKFNPQHKDISAIDIRIAQEKVSLSHKLVTTKLHDDITMQLNFAKLMAGTLIRIARASDRDDVKIPPVNMYKTTIKKIDDIILQLEGL